MSETITKVPDFSLSQYAFELNQKNYSHTQQQAVEYIKDQISKENLAPYYKFLSQEYLQDKTILPWDESLYEKMHAENKAEIAKLEQKLKTVEEEDEDNELDKVKCIVEIGEYYAKIGDREHAIEHLRKAFETSSSTGTKIDILLTISRIGFFFNDIVFVKTTLEEANTLIEKGGDWERRNRYKAYYGIHLMSIRKFDEAASLLTDSLTTFTSTEIATYELIAQLAVLSGILAFDRKDLKSKVVDSPEILALINTSPELKLITNLSNSLYYANYPEFFPTLSEIYEKILLPSKYLNVHAKYYLREIRRRAYAQLLDSYKTLSLKSMAEQFGVSVDFLDADLCKYIPSKKLNCVIDKVNGIVETNRPDNKNAQYQAVIKQGDALLTKLQKYGAAVKLSGISET